MQVSFVIPVDTKIPWLKSKLQQSAAKLRHPKGSSHKGIIVSMRLMFTLMNENSDYTTKLKFKPLMKIFALKSELG